MESPPASPPDHPSLAIEARGLTRAFGGREVVRDVDLVVAPGEFLGFLGPNGAGKTTTIRLLTGLLPATRGEARLLGLPVSPDQVEFKRRVGVLPEDLALFERLSVEEHLVLAGRLQGLAPATAAGRAADLLAALDLVPHRHLHAAEASHGTRKKTALGMALIHAPGVLFLDEPFTGLDPLAARTLRRLLERLTARGVTIFLTSHVLPVVEQLCTRVALLVEGRVVADVGLADLRQAGGSLEELFTRHAGPSPAELEMPWLA